MDDLLKKYKEINESYKTKLIFHFGTGQGIYSEFNNMILCMLYCLENKIQFRIYSKDTFFAFGNGFKEFFIPFCIENRNPIHHYINTRASVFKKYPRLINLTIGIYKFFTGNLLTFDIFSFVRTTWFEKMCFNIPELGISGSTQESCNILINIIYRFNEKYRNAIQEKIVSINLPPKYLGFHIRAGWKKLERDLISAENYIKIASEKSEVRDAFVFTDDYNIILELKNKFNDWNIYTLTNPDENGYEPSQFLQSKERTFSDLIKVFSSIEILCNSELLFCTFSSNPGMFCGMRMSKEKVFGLDYKNWIIL